jgi:hypothetical protein
MTTAIHTLVAASLAIWLGSPIQAPRAGIVVQQSIYLRVGQVILYTAEAEGTIHNFPDWSILPMTMYQSSAVVVFPSGVTPPDVALLSGGASTFPWGGTVVSQVQGMDLGQTTPNNYYYPVSRSGAFQAPAADAYTVVLYMWGGISAPMAGMAAMVYPGTVQMTLAVLP